MILDLIKKSRSYRGFDPGRKVTKEEMDYMLECARFGPNSMNKQAIRFYIALDEETVSAIQPLTGWAKAMPQIQLPHPGKYPTAFVVICLDKTISDSVPMFIRDASIAAQNMLLGATELGLGGCMLGSFQAGALRSLLKLPERFQPLLVVALGKPDETVVLTEARPGEDTAYYRDAQDVHYVPKRSARELIINYCGQMSAPEE